MTLQNKMPNAESMAESQPFRSSKSRLAFSAETLFYGSQNTIVQDIKEDLESLEKVPPAREHGGCNSSTVSVAMRASFRGLDGGYGWVITLGSFISFLVEGAFERGEGIMYPHFLERFHESYQLTALPCAMASTLRFLLSPLASLVCNHYSIRASVMFGAIVFTSGMFLTQFADSILLLLFTYGILTGCGRAFFSGPALVVIGLYFHQRRGLASGMALSGVGFGSFLLVPLIDYLLEHFNFQGAFLILSGIAANIIVVAMLYRPLSTNNRYLAIAAQRKMHALVAKQPTKEEHGNTVVDFETLTSFKEEMRKAKAISTRDSDGQMSLPFLLTKSGRLETKTVKPQSSASKWPSCFQRLYTVLCDNCCCNICFPVEDFHRNQDGQRQNSVFQLHLVREKAFMFYCITTFFFTGNFKVVMMFLPTLVQSKGHTLQEAALMFSLTGLLDVISRISFGFLLDVQLVRQYRMQIFNFVLLCMAFLAAILPAMSSFIWAFVVLGMFSLCGSLYLISRTLVLVDLIGEPRLSNAFGILMFFQGIGTLLSPLLAGLLLDIYGNVSYSFYLASAFGAASTVCMFASVYWHNLSAR
ncbi:hypothetical protein RRG08_037277 [Elysia crispata]|uniref:Major facilitator superfamily (MFS) profile domain-containing protein n=1 Tax=Elysia crispata TaxID=231223 RepID=A0AAE0XXR9_9GAST|nr:hypothetical protein RRG08_037277 [Elysia crispata]